MKRPALAALLSVVAVVTLTHAARAQVEMEERREPVRRGVWLNAGGGWGSFGCSVCQRATGFAGNLVIGGSLGETFLMGVGLTGVTRTDSVIVRTIVVLDARLRFYFTTEHNLFVTVGAGFGSISGDVFPNVRGERGTGGVLGVGYDLPLSRRLYVTPYVQLFGAKTETLDANVVHVGLSLTFH